MKKIISSLPFKLLLGVILGILIGQVAGERVMNLVVTVKYILNQVITFCVPLIIIGFIAPSITRLGNNASKMLGVAVTVAYISSIGAALFAMTAGYVMIPYLSIATDVNGLKDLPGIVFQLDIPQIMPVMSALVFSLLLGLAATWTKAKVITEALEEFQEIVLSIVTKVVIPMLPVFIAFTFCALSYEGTITRQLPVFFQVVDDRTFYLAGTALCSRRHLFREESDGCHQKLRTCLYYRSRYYVISCYPGCSTPLCEKVTAYFT